MTTPIPSPRTLIRSFQAAAFLMALIAFAPACAVVPSGLGDMAAVARTGWTCLASILLSRDGTSLTVCQDSPGVRTICRND